MYAYIVKEFTSQLKLHSYLKQQDVMERRQVGDIWVQTHIFVRCVGSEQVG